MSRKQPPQKQSSQKQPPQKQSPQKQPPPKQPPQKQPPQKQTPQKQPPQKQTPQKQPPQKQIPLKKLPPAPVKEPSRSKSSVDIPADVAKLQTNEIITKTHLLTNDTTALKNAISALRHDMNAMAEKKRMNLERIKVNKQLPYMVSNIVEILDAEKECYEDEGSVKRNEGTKEKWVIIKTSTRATYFLPNSGLLSVSNLKPNDLVGVNKDSHVMLERLPAEYDSRIKAMELDQRPKGEFSDIGGLDKQVQELKEVIIWPLQNKDKFKKIGIVPPKGVLMYGPPGTGKTLLARTLAAQTKSTFLKLAGPQLVQMFIGDGAKLVRDCFALAKEKAPSIIFIDEIDAVGGKRFNSEKSGDREVQRTMLELLNQLDGFQPNDDIKVIAATNRVDVLDPALVRSGRLDRKVELPPPDEHARVTIMKIHSQKMNLKEGIKFEELSRGMDDFNGAECKAVCTEAGMIALRRNATTVTHEDFVDATMEVKAKKKSNLNYYA